MFICMWMYIYFRAGLCVAAFIAAVWIVNGFVNPVRDFLKVLGNPVGGGVQPSSFPGAWADTGPLANFLASSSIIDGGRGVSQRSLISHCLFFLRSTSPMGSRKHPILLWSDVASSSRPPWFILCKPRPTKAPQAIFQHRRNPFGFLDTHVCMMSQTPRGAGVWEAFERGCQISYLFTKMVRSKVMTAPEQYFLRSRRVLNPPEAPSHKDSAHSPQGPGHRFFPRWEIFFLPLK